MHYAVCGGWFIEPRHFDRVDRALCGVVREHGFPTALTCGHMPGAEKQSLEWGRIMLVPRLTMIDIIMINERSAAFYDHKPDALICFPSGSPANDALRTYLAARDILIIEVKA